MIYFVLFGFTYILFMLSDRSKGILRGFFVLSGILLICLFAGARDIGIGTDTLVYGYSTYLSSMDRGLAEHVSALAASSAPLFNVYAWVSARLTGSFAGMLFFIQLGSFLPFYLAIRKASPDKTAVCVLIYMLLVFPFTMNALKQGIAVSLVFVAGCFAFRRRPVPFCVTLLIAVGFHLTAVVGILLYPLALLVRGTDDTTPLRRRTFMFVAIVVFICYAVVILFGEELVRMVAPLRGAYSYQLNAIGQGSVSIGNLLLFVAFAVVGGMCLEDKGKGLDRERSFLYILTVVGMAAYQFDVVAESLSRFAYYGVVFAPLFYRRMLGAQRRENYVFVVVLFVLIVLVFAYSVILMGHQAVYPYTSTILGI